MSTFALNKDKGLPLKTLDNNDGSVTLAMMMAKFSPPPEADSGTVEYPSATVELYKFRQGGITGTVLKTITLTYTDSTKDALESWAAS